MYLKNKRYISQSLRNAGDVKEAFETCLKLYQNNGPLEEAVS